MTVSVSGTAIDAVDYADFLAALDVAASATTGVTFDDTSGLLTFTAAADGDSLAPIVFSVAAIDDVLVEGDEDFTVAFTGANSSTGATVTAGDDADAVVITDNDTANFTLAQSSTSIDEGDAVTFTLTLDGSDSGAPGAATVQAGNTASVDIGLALLLSLIHI